MVERSFRMRLAVALARTALLWERLARVWWPAALFPALFAVAAVFGLWRALGDPWRAGALVLAVLAAVFFVIRGLRAGPWPGRAEALRRVEEDSGFAGRPFEALDDDPALADFGGRALWRAHQRRMREAAAQAKTRRPKAALAAADPMATRGMLVLTALAAVMIAGPATMERLADAFAPRLMAGGGSGVAYQAWINPPEYTGRAPIFLEARSRGRRVQAPEGAEFVARAAGAGGAPRLRVQTRGEYQRIPFESAGPGAHEARLVLDRDAVVSIASSSAFAWDVEVVADTPPTVEFISVPEANQRQYLEFAYRVQDDYGAETVVLRITRRTDDGVETLEEAITTPLSSEGEEETTLDLTTHPWAGLEADLQIVAVDGLGQEGRSAPVRMTLPERVFVNPLARAIIHERRQLIRSDEAYAPLPERPVQYAEDARMKPPVQPDELERRIGRAPEVVARARRSLELMQDGAEHFEEDLAVHLALAYLSDRLQRGRDRVDIADVPDMMWLTALRAEGGDLADAERALREAQEALAEALARGAPEEEIAELMENFQDAVDRYLEALTAQAILEGNVLEEFAGGMDGMMGEDALQEMLQALQELSEAGATDDARRLLQALSEMLLNMQMQLAMGQGGQGQPPSPELEELREGLEELSDLIARQRELMDQTQRESGNEGEEQQDGQDGQQGGQQAQNGQQGRPEGTPSDEGGVGNFDLAEDDPRNGRGGGRLSEEMAQALAEQQAELAERLEALGDELAERESEDGAAGPDSTLDEAGEAMGLAERELRSGDGEEALVGQGEALDRLRAAVERLAQQAMQQARRDAGLNGEASEQREDQRDPFGRRSGAGGLGTGDDIDIPDEDERRRAREILEELRTRLEESGRPQEELDYLLRLLDRF